MTGRIRAADVLSHRQPSECSFDGDVALEAEPVSFGTAKELQWQDAGLERLL